MAPPVLLDHEDGVAGLRLNRPEASNALNQELLEEMAWSALCCSAPRVRTSAAAATCVSSPLRASRSRTTCAT